MGLVFSIPAGFGAMLGPESPEFTHTMALTATIVMGMVYGFLIELITTVVFKAKQE
jgi:preprotein translocase subunit Sss1